ncbi:MAG: TIGR04013 family B12-binding domain/radical SAM domain-containing protein [Candidatus Hodarchaeota archaeon]
MMPIPYKKYIVLLYWDKTTWYALGALVASLKRHNIPYKVIKGDVIEYVQNLVLEGYHVIYGEASRNMTLNSLKNRLKGFRKKKLSSNLITVIGGPQASGNPQEILEMGVDYVVIGEGEITFPKLIQTLVINNFQKESAHDILGIAYQNSLGEVIRTPSRERINLNEYCPYSDDIEFPLHPPIELMRGCAFRCRFCQVPYIYGNPRFRSIDAVMKIVEHYIDHFKPLKKHTDIRFIAPNSLGYMEKKRGQPNVLALKDLVTHLKDYDIRLFFGTFPSEIRPEYITEETIDLFDDVYNTQISVGFQSGSDRILSEMRRGHTVSDGLNAFDLLISHGLIPVFDFILGSPSETEAEQWETLSLIRELGNKAHVRLHYFMPLPGTPWESGTPVPLYPKIQKEIGRLAKDEIISGNFVKQFQFAFNEH